MHTTARADHKELSAKKALCRSRLERWHGNYCTGIVLFLWVAAKLWRIQQPRNHYAHARALSTLLLLQAAPLKCALDHTWHCVPHSQASLFRRVNETMWTHHSNVLMKQCAHHCVQGTSKICRVNIQITDIHTSLLGLQPYNAQVCPNYENNVSLDQNFAVLKAMIV